MNPWRLEAYNSAEKLKDEKRDTQMWMMGAYVFEAVSKAIGNAFRKKGAKASQYRDKPLMMENKEQRGELTKEEKVEKTKTVFKMLQIMQANYELSKKFDNKHHSKATE